MGNRRLAVIGAFCGLAMGLVISMLMPFVSVESVSLLPVGSTAVQVVMHLVAAAGIGAVFGWISPDRARVHAALASTGLIVGMLWWSLGSLTLVPLFLGDTPTWTLAQAIDVFPNLVAALLHGSLTGLVYAGVGHTKLVASAVGDNGDPPEPLTRVVVLGGGFGGIAVAQQLEQHALQGSGLDVTLVSSSNYLLFTPMLAEVAGSSLQPQHISVPVRAACPRTRFVRGVATRIDVEAQVIHLTDTPRETVPFDHLVLALGSVPSYHGLPGLHEHSLPLKSLADATRLRNHCISMMERADGEGDPEERRRQLTFVVAGAGFAGSEMVAELFDLAYSALRYYPDVPIKELRFVLVHSRERILPEIGPELAEYALQKLRARGIEVVLGTRVKGATADALLLDDGTDIPTRTVVWTAGNQPSPLLSGQSFELGPSGAVVVEDTMQVVGTTNLWAVGDCAQIPDPDNGGDPYPPTAQHASRQGKTLADNILASHRGQSLKPFRFASLGTLVALGHQTAVAEIKGRRFSGLLAWFLWRNIYLFKLPGLEKKLRVVIDWTLDLLFQRDIVLTSPPSDHPPADHEDTSNA